jgi:uncharacterized protein involved in exopolysaccharide biosynthesis
MNVTKRNPSPLFTLYRVDSKKPLFSGETLDLVAVISVVYRSRLVLVFSTLLAMVAGYLFTFQMQSLYTSKSSVYVVDTKERGSNLLSGIGAMANVLGYGGGSGGSTELALPDLLGSRHLFLKLAQKEIPALPPPEDSPVELSLNELWFSNANSLEERLENTVIKLKSQIKVHSSLESNLVQIEATAETPRLAEYLNSTLVTMANSYYLATRKEEIAAKIDFYEENSAELKEALNNSENKLVTFLSANKEYQQSPLLMQEYSRLMREIEINKQIFLDLESQRLQAQMEYQSQPAHVRLLNEPTVPLEPSAPERLKLVFLIMIAMVLLNIGISFVLNSLAPDPSSEPQG